jgi:hypothetical protein
MKQFKTARKYESKKFPRCGESEHRKTLITTWRTTSEENKNGLLVHAKSIL